ncbi:MAG: butyrate kinase [bacterium]|nr:butyrate kinase [bacterium]
MKNTVLVINPGSTSTKIAIWATTGSIFQQTVTHPSEELAKFPKVVDQFDLRLGALMEAVGEWLDSDKLSAVVGRGGPLRPLEGGTYFINEPMLIDLRAGKYSNHASNLGALMAHYLAGELTIPCFVVDPVTVDEFSPFARISGLPEIVRKCRSHALNIKAVAREAAAMVNQPLDQCNFVVVHMGGGLSICPLAGGKIIDVNDALLGMGPFSPERAGALPIGPLVELCFSGKYSKPDLLQRLSTNAGLKGYLGTPDLIEIEKRIESGDQEALLHYNAMCYQIGKEIGAAAVVLKGRFDGIVMTGGMANSARLIDTLKEYVSFLGRIFVIPGEKEMEALALGAFRVLDGKEKAKTY